MTQPQQPPPPSRSEAGEWDKARAAQGGKADMPPRPADPPPPQPDSPQGALEGPAPGGGKNN